MKADPTHPLSFSQKGFTLLEMLVSMAIVGIISVLLLEAMTRHVHQVNDDFRIQRLTNLVRLVRVRLTKDLRTLGLDTYYTANADDRQRNIAWAGPYQLVFNADLDTTRGPIKVDGDEVPKSIGEADTAGLLVYSPAAAYVWAASDGAPTNYTAGAETIRIGFDWTGDGRIDEDDLEDAFWAEEEMGDFASPHPRDLVLVREVFGYDADAESPENLGPRQILATGLRAWLSVDDTYPNGSVPEPLFYYWGYFGSESSPDASPVERLWGDESGDGVLSTDEILAWVDASEEDRRVEYSETEIDANGDGVLNTQLDEVLTRITINVTLESGRMTPDVPNVARSDQNGNGDIDADETSYPYTGIVVHENVLPRNIRLPGRNRSDF